MKKGFTPLEIRRRRRMTVAPGNLSLTGFTPLEIKNTIGVVLRKRERIYGKRKFLTGFTPLEVRAKGTASAPGGLLLTGFTFIELIISVAIVSIVGVAVYGVFSNGMKIWRRANVSRLYDRNVRLALEKFARELRNSFEFTDISFEGDENFLKFPSLINISLQDSYPYQVGKATYFFDAEEKIFFRKQENHLELFASARDEEDENEEDDEDDEDDEKASAIQIEKIKASGSVKELIGGVKELTFSYCYLDNASGMYEWKDDWKKKDQSSYPQAVKIELTLEGGSEEEAKLSRIIFMPIGTGKQKIVVGTTTESR